MIRKHFKEQCDMSVKLTGKFPLCVFCGIFDKNTNIRGIKLIKYGENVGGDYVYTRHVGVYPMFEIK